MKKQDPLSAPFTTTSLCFDEWKANFYLKRAKGKMGIAPEISLWVRNAVLFPLQRKNFPLEGNISARHAHEDPPKVVNNALYLVFLILLITLI